MTGREKILAAFAPEGTQEIAAVACYEGILLRDHYADLTHVPWWDSTQPDIVARDFVTATGLQWYCVDACPPREWRDRQRVEHRDDGVWRVDTLTGDQQPLSEPPVGGSDATETVSVHRSMDALPATTEDIDALVSPAPVFDRDRFLAEGRDDDARAVRGAVDVLLYGHVSSPLWSLYGLIGYEGMMILPAQDPDLALYAGQRLCEHVRQRVRMIAALGADVVWIEECLTDQLSPDLFRRLNLPLLRQCTDEIRAQGLKSVYYYCGGPWDRMDAILDVGADAVHFEESKKGFTIHVEDIVQAVRGRCTVFGNLDAIGVLQNATEADVRSQVARQLTAGRRNGGRFVMSLGSPITPATPVERVRCYTDAVQRC